MSYDTNTQKNAQSHAIFMVMIIALVSLTTYNTIGGLIDSACTGNLFQFQRNDICSK